MRKAKNALGFLSMICLIVFIATYFVYDAKAYDFKTNEIISNTNLIFYFLFFPVFYTFVLLSDIVNQRFRFLKILHYLLFAGCVISMFFQLFVTGWMGSFIVYFHMAVIGNLLIMTIIRYTVLKYSDISLKKEWIWFGIWFVLLIIFLAIPKGELTQEYNVKMNE